MAKSPVPFRLPSGRWRIRWFNAAGERKSVTFDTYNEARAALARAQATADEIRTGERIAPPPPSTFDELCEHWRRTRGANKRSKDTDECRLRAHLIPAFAGLPLTEITYERIEAFKADRGHLAPQTVKHLVNLLSAMLNHALRLGWLLRVPYIDRPKVGEQDFSYLRTGAEIRALLDAARDDGDDAYMLYKTAIFTGLREGELAALRWDRVNFNQSLITVDRGWKGPTKSDRVRHVPLVNSLLPELRAWRLRSPGDLVFVNTRGDPLRRHGRIFRERLHRCLDAAGFERPEQGRRTHYITFHDLRHTFASHWMMSGGDVFKLRGVLGHRSIETTMRYAHLSPHAFAADLARFDGLVGGVDDGVVLALPGGGRVRS